MNTPQSPIASIQPSKSKDSSNLRKKHIKKRTLVTDYSDDGRSVSGKSSSYQPSNQQSNNPNAVTESVTSTTDTSAMAMDIDSTNSVEYTSESSDDPTELFSPKYSNASLSTLDGSGTGESSNNGLNGPADTPVRTKKQPSPLSSAVKSMKRSVWTCTPEELEGLRFMRSVSKLPDEFFHRIPKCLPPLNSGVKKHNSESKLHTHTLVLDLDETLVHCTIEESPRPDLIFPVNFNGETYRVHMRKRPHFQDFLTRMSQFYEIVVFTASQKCYADKLLNYLDPQSKLIKYRLFRDSCIQIDGNFVKDLRVLGRDLSKTIIVDNSPPAFSQQINNGIPIVSWFDDDADIELQRAMPVLERLSQSNDVRPHIKKFFKMEELLKSLPKF